MLVRGRGRALGLPREGGVAGVKQVRVAGWHALHLRAVPVSSLRVYLKMDGVARLEKLRAAHDEVGMFHVDGTIPPCKSSLWGI